MQPTPYTILEPNGRILVQYFALDSAVNSLIDSKCQSILNFDLLLNLAGLRRKKYSSLSFSKKDLYFNQLILQSYVLD
jgi:hypothetical protein